MGKKEGGVGGAHDLNKKNWTTKPKLLLTSMREGKCPLCGHPQFYSEAKHQRAQQRAWPFQPPRNKNLPPWSMRQGSVAVASRGRCLGVAPPPPPPPKRPGASERPPPPPPPPLPRRTTANTWGEGRCQSWGGRAARVPKGHTSSLGAALTAAVLLSPWPVGSTDKRQVTSTGICP